MNIPAGDLRSCYGCKHFDQGGTDHDTGYSFPTHCEVAAELYGNGECSERVSIVLESILFQLSVLNNCPMREEARQRMTITKGRIRE